MDGTLAMIWLATSLSDMYLNDCADGCLKTERTFPRASVQFADVLFNEDSVGQEFYIGYDSHRQRGPFRPTYGLSMTSDGSTWFGIGWKWNSQNIIDSPLFVETSMMPGLYGKHEGIDLGGVLQFRSAIGVGYEFENNSTLTVVYDHRSNADLQALNPGLETLSIRYAVRWE